MAEGGFEPYHVPQQSRRDKLRVVVSQHQLPLQGCAAGLVPILDPALISSDLITCAGPGLHHHNSSLCNQSSNSAAASDAKEESSNFMGYIGGGMIGATSSSSATNQLYVDPQSSVQLNPSPIQDISGSPFFYNPQSLRFLEQSFHGGEVMVYRPEPVSLGHGPNANDHINSSNSNNNSNKCVQGLSLSLSSHHSQQTSLPLELNLQRYDPSMYSAKVVSTGGCFFPTSGDGSTSNELLSRSSVPLGPFTGYSSILRGSRFLKPAQQLLEELCDVGRGVYLEKMVATDSILWDPPLECFSGTGSGTDDDPRSCRNGGENENRKKKSRLISMLNEVYRRYKQYYQQMQAVISSFETVAGVRNAAPFASLALKAMSKHFRYLKNAITEQLQLMIDSRGHITNDKDAAPGFENPGTGIHCPRPPQNTAFVEHHHPVWRPQRGLPERAVTVLRSWLFEHFLHPYPTDTDKLMLAKQTGLSRNQVSNWFINARVRLWKPMVEEIHMLETRQVAKSSQIEEQIGNGQNHDRPIPSSLPIASENASSTPIKRCRELVPKRTRNDMTMIPSGNDNDVMNVSYENSSAYVPSGSGFGVSKASGSGGVSLTLGLYQNNANNNLGLADPYPVNAARRFGLDANGEGYAAVITPNREFGREIVEGQLLHDFVG